MGDTLNEEGKKMSGQEFCRKRADKRQDEDKWATVFNTVNNLYLKHLLF